MADDQDWRLKVELPVATHGSVLDHLLSRVHAPDIAEEVGRAIPHNVAVTHDGKLLFAYAATREALDSARTAIELVLRKDGIDGTMLTSHWDGHLDEWLQVDPPLTGAAKRAEDVFERNAAAVEERTLIASSGNLIRTEFEQTMREWADKLDLRCEVIEHPHLLRTQVAFTVTGPRRKIDEFADGLKAEGLATMRSELAVMASPL
jgi:hypothetical protein